MLLHTERFKLAQQLQDEELARTAVAEWIKYDPDNQQLQEIYNSLHPTGINSREHASTAVSLTPSSFRSSRSSILYA